MYSMYCSYPPTVQFTIETAEETVVSIKEQEEWKDQYASNKVLLWSSNSVWPWYWGGCAPLL